MSEFRIRETGEIVSQGEIRRRNANTSLPSVWNESVLESLGVDVVFVSPEPINTDPLKTVRRAGVELDSKGNWVEKYEVVDMFAEYTDNEGNVVTKASQEEAYLARRNEEQWKSIRQQRDSLLKDTDWLSIRAADTGVAMNSTWADYRQALRDISTQEDPFAIVWPSKPE